MQVRLSNIDPMSCGKDICKPRKWVNVEPCFINWVIVAFQVQKLEKSSRCMRHDVFFLWLILGNF